MTESVTCQLVQVEVEISQWVLRKLPTLFLSHPKTLKIVLICFTCSVCFPGVSSSSCEGTICVGVTSSVTSVVRGAVGAGA